MPKVARLTDLFAGTCTCCPAPMTGLIITSSNDTFVNELGEARLTDVVLGFCGHTGIIVSASNDVFTNNLRVARLGDAVAGCLVGVIVTGSENLYVND